MPVLKTSPSSKIEFKYHAPTGQLSIAYKADLTNLVEEMKARRADEGSKKGALTLFAKIPNEIVYELKKKGIDIFKIRKDPGMRKRFFREIQYNYPHLKAVNWKHL